MGVFDWKIQWKRTIDKDKPIDILDCIKATISKSTEIKNNICNLTFKNSPTNIANDGSTVIGDYIDPDTLALKFNEDDEMRVWADYLDDATEVDTDWTDDDRLIGAFAVEEYQVQTQDNQSRVQLQCVDYAYLLFNSIYNFSYGVTNTFTAPGIIRNCARKFGEGSGPITTAGTEPDDGTQYAVDSKFVSEGGYIEDQRRKRTSTNPDVYSYDVSTTLNGAITNAATTITLADASSFENSSDASIVIGSEHIAYTAVSGNNLTGCVRGIDDTVAASHGDGTTVYQGFPQILMSKIWKPLFEWIGEISQTTNTNYLSEVQEGGTTYFNRAFLFWVDKNNAAHWFYPDDVVDLTIELSEEGRRSFKLEKSVFDAVNFVIYHCGEDMYGNGILYYLYDDTSDVSALKMRYQPMTKIAQTLVAEDITGDALASPARTRETTNQDIYKSFVVDGDYNFSPSFLTDANNFRARSGTAARTNVTNDADYNAALREAAKERGYIEAQKITTNRMGLRWSGQIALKGTHINPGDLVQVTNPFVGLNSQLLRVKEVTHSINSNSWETTISVEEDEKREA